MSIEKLGQDLVAVEDPRCPGKVEHRLVEVLVIAVCVVIACAESWDDIALYGRSKLAWLRTFLDLPNRIPSHDTFRRVFMLIDPDAFEAGFTKWVGSLTDRFEREVVAIDGKTTRRSFDHVSNDIGNPSGVLPQVALLPGASVSPSRIRGP